MAFFDDVRTVKPNDDRVDGRLKVTGKARYSAEYALKGMVHAVLVTSTIAKGSISSFDLSKAKAAGGVIDILTHENAPQLAPLADEQKAKEQRLGLRVLHTNEIFSNGQPIALVVADTLEQALYAASLVKVNYTKADANTDFSKMLPSVTLQPDGKKRGDENGWQSSTHKFTGEYMLPMEVHNPMEMHATIAHWTAADKLVLYDKTQGVKGVQRSIARLFNIPPENINVQAPFVGGGFGSGLRVWANTIAAAMAAKKINRPVKLMLTRPQMFTMVGYRPAAWQKLSIGADADGKFTGVVHEAIGQTSTYENFTEGITGMTRMLYSFPHFQAKYATVPLNVNTPVWMRGPGEATGAVALESAIDELSYQLHICPVALRLKNLPEKDPDSGLPWSSNYFKECLQLGAEKFGWAKRKQEVKANRHGDWWVGYGVGCGAWRAMRGGASAKVVLRKDGSLLVQSSVTDIGPGTGTAMMVIAHENTGIAKNNIVIEIGNSDYANAPSQGGSATLSTVGAAVADACTALKKKLLELAVVTTPAFKDVAVENILLQPQGIGVKNNALQLSYAELLSKNNITEVSITQESRGGGQLREYAFYSFITHFAEVRVHALTGVPHVTRMLCVVDGGKIVSEKTATSQITGAAVGGIGMALMEEQKIDHRFGRQIGNDLAGYHFPVNADAPIIETHFINKPDPYLNPMGAKGIGEVGIIGSAAAIANAVYNATGIRVREFPITPDKLL